MKRKKFWIGFGIVCTCIIAVLVVFSLVFRLRTVDVEIRTRTQQAQTKLPDGVREKVIESGNFEYGRNLIFYNTDANVAKIEKATPYVKVEQVIRFFPNILRVYISERTMCYRVQDRLNPSNWYILDRDFKVLEIVNSTQITESSDYFNKTFAVSADTMTLSAEAGDFVDSKSIQGYLNSIADGVYARTRDIGKISTVSLSEKDGELNAEITMKGRGIKIIAVGADDLAEKVRRAATLVYNEDMVEDPENTIFTVYKDYDGEIVVLKQK